jgi:hypothetical protein
LLLFVRHPVAVFPEYFRWKDDGGVTPGWPVTHDSSGIEGGMPSGRRTMRSDGSNPRFLEWAVTNDVEIWVPTESEFSHAEKELTEARDRYYAAIQPIPLRGVPAPSTTGIR